MVSVTRHLARVLAPHYASAPETALHRYLDDAFVPAFLADLSAGKLGEPERVAWRDADRFGGAHEPLTLRLPVHRAHYIVSCEVACDAFGLPSLDPRRISGAGFVLRRGSPAIAPEGWLVARGVPVGWSAALQLDADPDLARRGAGKRLATRPPVDPPFSGERTHPLHSAQVRAADGRLHTVLYGYLPLGGESTAAADAADEPRVGVSRGSIDLGRSDAQLAQDARDAFKSLLVPFGERDEGGGDVSWPWTALAWTDGVLRAKEPLLELVRLAVLGFRVGLERNASSARFANALERLRLFRRRHIWSWELWEYVAVDEPAGNLLERIEQTLASIADRGLDELDSLGSNHKALQLLRYLGLERGLPGEDDPLEFAKQFGDPEPELLRLDVTAEDAEFVRAEIAAALVEDMRANLPEIPLPRFGRDPDELYHVVPFVRVDHEGCEHVYWGPPSTTFKIASPWHPKAQRPVTIPLPRLSDLKSLGAHFLASDDLATALKKIKPLAGLKQTGGASGGAGLCWRFSLSIPAVTICALILLMILLNILQAIFWWMPWVFQALPFPCKPEVKLPNVPPPSPDPGGAA